MSSATRSPHRATALTLITKLRRGGSVWLRVLFWLATKLPLPDWTLLRLRLIHFARWSILSHFPPGAPRGSREGLPHRCLLFESNFNGTPDAYVEAFSYVFPRGMKAIWRSSEGFPGPVPVESLRAWIARGGAETAHYYCAYPEASTKQVLAALEVRRRLREFGSRTDDLAAGQFEAEYRKLVADLQRAL